MEDFKLIPLSQGQYAKVDAEDYEWLSQWKWSARYNQCTKSFYAIRGGNTVMGKRLFIRMHRQLLGLEHGDGISGDHINHDTLDNRRLNLRKANNAQSRQNRRMFERNKSGYKGVAIHKVSGKFAAYVKVDGKTVYLGLFENARDAALVRDSAEIKSHGEFAWTNFGGSYAVA